MRPEGVCPERDSEALTRLKLFFNCCFTVLPEIPYNVHTKVHIKIIGAISLQRRQEGGEEATIF
jgi:hypothetical protein